MQFLKHERPGVRAIWLDTASLDIAASTDFPAHVSWLPSWRYGIENLANLDRVPPSGAVAIVGAPAFAGGSGGPTRQLALVTSPNRLVRSEDLSVSEWVTVATTADVPEGEMLGATVGGAEVLVANVDGEYRSIGSERPHASCLLHEDGELDEDQRVATCQCHGSVFDLETGEAVGPPASDGVRVYRVRVGALRYRSPHPRRSVRTPHPTANHGSTAVSAGHASALATAVDVR